MKRISSNNRLTRWRSSASASLTQDQKTPCKSAPRSLPGSLSSLRRRSSSPVHKPRTLTKRRRSRRIVAAGTSVAWKLLSQACPTADPCECACANGHHRVAMTRAPRALPARPGLARQVVRTPRGARAPSTGCATSTGVPGSTRRHQRSFWHTGSRRRLRTGISRRPGRWPGDWPRRATSSIPTIASATPRAATSASPGAAPR